MSCSSWYLCMKVSWTLWLLIIAKPWIVDDRWPNTGLRPKISSIHCYTPLHFSVLFYWIDVSKTVSCSLFTFQLKNWHPPPKKNRRPRRSLCLLIDWTCWVLSKRWKFNAVEKAIPQNPSRHRESDGEKWLLLHRLKNWQLGTPSPRKQTRRMGTLGRPLGGRIHYSTSKWSSGGKTSHKIKKNTVIT